MQYVNLMVRIKKWIWIWVSSNVKTPFHDPFNHSSICRFNCHSYCKKRERAIGVHSLLATPFLTSECRVQAPVSIRCGFWAPLKRYHSLFWRTSWKSYFISHAYVESAPCVLRDLQSWSQGQRVSDTAQVSRSRRRIFDAQISSGGVRTIPKYKQKTDNQDHIYYIQQIMTTMKHCIINFWPPNTLDSGFPLKIPFIAEIITCPYKS